MKNVLIAVGILAVILGVAAYLILPSAFRHKAAAEIRNFEDCAEAGNLVVDTKPRECHTKSKQIFIEVYNGALLKEVIRTTSPKPNEIVTSPFKLSGEAIGGWYFNEQLNVRLEDEDGKVLYTKSVKATSKVKKGTFVPFTAAITFDVDQTATPTGRLVIERTNPDFNKGELGPLVIPVEFGK